MASSSRFRQSPFYPPHIPKQTKRHNKLKYSPLQFLSHLLYHSFLNHPYLHILTGKIRISDLKIIILVPRLVKVRFFGTVHGGNQWGYSWLSNLLPISGSADRVIRADVTVQGHRSTMFMTPAHVRVLTGPGPECRMELD